MNHALRTLTIADYDAVLQLWQDTEGVGLNESDRRENIAIFLARNHDLSRVTVVGA